MAGVVEGGALDGILGRRTLDAEHLANDLPPLYTCLMPRAADSSPRLAVDSRLSTSSQRVSAELLGDNNQPVDSRAADPGEKVCVCHAYSFTFAKRPPLGTKPKSNINSLNPGGGAVE